MFNKIISGMLAGLMISLGGAVFLMCYPDHRIVGAVLFSVGLLSVCWKGYSLFTGKIGLILANHSKEDIAVLLLGLLGNGVATIICGYLLAWAIPEMKEAAVLVTEAKLAQPHYATFIRGIFCGILIYLAVDIYKNHRTPLGIIFAVPAFILSGFEHSIADMFYFSCSGIASGETFLKVVLIVLGNTVGGLVIPLLGMLASLSEKLGKRKSAPAIEQSEAADQGIAIGQGEATEQPADQSAAAEQIAAQGTTEQIATAEKSSYNEAAADISEN